MSIENPFNNPPQETPKPEEKIEEQSKPENSEVLPTAENAERVEFTPEEIEEARQEMEAELLERKKVEIISKAALDLYKEDVNKMVVAINRSLGGRAESISVWEGMRQQLSRSAMQELSASISKIKDEVDPNSVVAKFVERMNQDLFESPGGGRKPYDVADADWFGITFAGYIEEHGAELTGKELEDVEAALKLATLNAQHKFFSWQSSGQLESVIAAQEALTKLNDEFDPARAGFFELRHVVENGLASIKLDFNSKPNYPYARPEFSIRQGDLSRMLSGLSKIEARQFLKDNEIDLEQSPE